mgnify:CR=1 FL=1
MGTAFTAYISESKFSDQLVPRDLQGQVLLNLVSITFGELNILLIANFPSGCL